MLSAHNSGVSSVIRKKLMGYVGFANLPNQVHRKSVRKGFQFTAMVVGTLTFFVIPTFSSFSKANPVWASLLSSTRCSTPPYIHPRSQYLLPLSGLPPLPSRA
jgi:hypothetical protein